MLFEMGVSKSHQRNGLKFAQVQGHPEDVGPLEPCHSTVGPGGYTVLETPRPPTL